MKLRLILWILLIVVGMVGVATTGQPPLKIAVLSGEKLPLSALQSLADSLARQLPGKREGKVVVFDSIEELLEAKDSGISLFIGGLYPALKFAEIFKGKAIAESTEMIRGKIIASSAEGIRNMKDLEGKVLGVGPSWETSDFFLPIEKLFAEGIRIRVLPRSGLIAPPTNLGYP
ncbi:hypothetical protein ACFLRA_01035 [Bdellovibrionota bacterium]